MEFTVYPIMPFDAVDLGRLFITHRLLYQDLPFIAGRIFSCQPLSVFTFSKVLNIRIKCNLTEINIHQGTKSIRTSAIPTLCPERGSNLLRAPRRPTPRPDARSLNWIDLQAIEVSHITRKRQPPPVEQIFQAPAVGQQSRRPGIADPIDRQTGQRTGTVKRNSTCWNCPSHPRLVQQG